MLLRALKGHLEDSANEGDPSAVHCISPMANIIRKCWDPNLDKRPDMDEEAGKSVVLNNLMGNLVVCCAERLV
uniref:Uncharacterized protein n=1 Tax=Zea mays TaxID=4577 RepID=A0A804M2I3_MAIZE